MIFGNFNDDLNQYILENSGRIGASKASTLALKNTGVPIRGPLENGKMYTFRYFTDDEKFYDTSPIVLSLGMTNAYNQLGINLHYIPYTIRIKFINEILTSFSGVIDTWYKFIDKPNKQQYIKEFTYDLLESSLGRKYNIKYAIRQYRMDRMRNPKLIGYADWYIGVVNDDNFFFGGDINEAQAHYYTYI